MKPQRSLSPARNIVNPSPRDNETIQYGFKRVSLANFTEYDNKTPHRSRLRGEKWVQTCLKPKLESCVPEEIAFLFEVARGSMIYGLFFEPLASLAGEQCYRVLEAGARRRCFDLGLLRKNTCKGKNPQYIVFSKTLAALKKAGHIPKSDLEHWDAIHFLRNRYSHPDSQALCSRDSALGVVELTSQLLNRLFADQRTSNGRVGE